MKWWLRVLVLCSLLFCFYLPFVMLFVGIMSRQLEAGMLALGATILALIAFTVRPSACCALD